jgi:hypothetical protein
LYCHSRTLALLAILIIASTTGPAWAWGQLGHRVISRLAEKELTSAASLSLAAEAKDRAKLSSPTTKAAITDGT